MYIGFLHIHDVLRWLLLISLVIALTKYMIGWLRNQTWQKSDHFLGVFITWIMDIQLITGLMLYFFLSPITKMAFMNFGGAMKDSELRFYAVEHFALMVIAVVLVHIGRAKTKKATSDLSKFKISSVYLLITLIVIMAGIPWGRL